ncbi:hypothetical protein NLJ89_g12230 [Agrocybe chaxingu]|uniref:Uncharacterized protein n=1 Tax=Agrocybe chaxingu TaxID=84603 RepID=A0A9W8JQW5_9AGAR|nr:hypothetical protein NLJ89_g12230 [Agrocybe chaxingu]
MEHSKLGDLESIATVQILQQQASIPGMAAMLKMLPNEKSQPLYNHHAFVKYFETTLERKDWPENDRNLDANLQRDKYARLCNTVNSLIDELTPAAPDFQLRDACDQLLNIMGENPEMQVQLVSSHGMLAILEVLEGRCSRDVVMKLLQIVNLLVTEDLGFLESFCLLGGILVMMEFTSKKYPIERRLEASNFIRLLCHTSVVTLQMFISCRGLKVLVDLLDEDYIEQTELVEHMASAMSSNCKAQQPRTISAACSFARDFWTRCLLLFLTSGCA